MPANVHQVPGDERLVVVRKPDENIQTYPLGHWEVGQLSLALDHYADYLRASTDASPETIQHTRDLGMVFGTGEATFSITKNWEPQ